MKFLQKSFVGGIDRISPPTVFPDDCYQWIVNARQRLGYIEPNKKNIQITDIPEGNLHGIIAVGNILIVFISGYAYYKQDESALPWIKVPSFQMDPDVERYYTETVPASTFHFVRKVDTSLNIHAPIIATQDFKVAGTPSGVVVQDGISQPWIIEYDSTNQLFVSRECKTFADWQNESVAANTREYVPIGKQMMYKDAILYIVSVDGSYIMRSITGRPLDFMINIDVNGNKLATEELGGAKTVSFALDFDEITCIKEIDVPDSFVVGTSTNLRIVTADYTRTIFGEPIYRVSAIIKSNGIVNQDCFVQSNNDYVFISPDGAKAFNAVQQLKFKGNNSHFSKQLESLLYNPTTKQQIKQVDCRCIEFGNYLLFNLDTLWGNLIAVYDDLLDKWVSLDITNALRIKQFCILESEVEIKLYCITQFDEMFQLYANAEETEVAELRVREFINEETQVEHKSAALKAFFDGGTFDGEAFVTEIVDEQISKSPVIAVGEDYRHKQELKSTLSGINYPVIPPVFPSNSNRANPVSFPMTKGLNGKKISFVLQWTTDARLLEIELETSDQAGQTFMKQRNNLIEAST